MWAHLEESLRFHFLEVHVKLDVQTWDENPTYLWLHKEAFNVLISINSMYAYVFVMCNNQRQT